MQESLTKVDFGNVIVNSSSTPEETSIICFDSTKLTVSITSGRENFSIKSGYSTVSTTGVAFPVEGTTYIIFTPTTVGEYRGTVRFTDKNNDTYETSLVGTGVAAK